MSYTSNVPKLWNDTIEAHRREVRDAVLDAAWELAMTNGLAAVTMSRIAERAGIGRATLYKYFPDVQSILTAWHQRQIRHHLHHLAEVRDQQADPGARLEAVLLSYARIQHQRAAHTRHGGHGTELSTLLHQGAQVTEAQAELRALIQGLLKDAARAGEVRTDVGSDELASYCLHALTAAGALPSERAVERLVEVTTAGLRPVR